MSGSGFRRKSPDRPAWPSCLITARTKVLAVISLAAVLCVADAAEATGAPAPPIWIFSKDGVSGLLVGTLHALPLDEVNGRIVKLQLRRELRRRIEGANTLVLERPPFSSARRPGGRAQPIDRLTYEAISVRMAHQPDGVLDSLVALPDWAIATELSARRFQRLASKDAAVSVEQELLSIAAEYGLDTIGLEPPDHVFTAMSQLDGAAQRMMLDDALVPDFQYKSQLKAVADAYLAGDHSAACRELEDGYAARKDYWETIVDERNRNWVEGMEKFRKGKMYVVAVGLAHTCRKSSLQSLMRDRGFTIVRAD